MTLRRNEDKSSAVFRPRTDYCPYRRSDPCHDCCYYRCLIVEYSYCDTDERFVKADICDKDADDTTKRRWNQKDLGQISGTKKEVTRPL